MNKQFVYIDSSQEQDNCSRLQPVNSQNQNEQQRKINSQSSPRKYRKCLSNDPSNRLLKQSEYDILVKNLLAQKIGAQFRKKLITNIQDKEYVENINKRNANYQYFLQKMEIDQKYKAIIQQKADKIKSQNQRKKEILYKHKNEDQLKQQQAQLKKFYVQKNHKQQTAVRNVQKHIVKLGFQRIYNAHKKIKEDVEQKKRRQQNQLESKLNRQRNQILELQQKYERIKQQKRINKLQQRKVIKQLTGKISELKQGFKQKYTKKQSFKV